SVAALGAMVSASFFTDLSLPGWLSLIIGLLTGLAAGAICGIATAYGKIPSFIATLAMMSIARGATLVISDGSPIATAPSVHWLGSTVAGIPIPIVMLVIAGLGCWVLLHRSVRGRLVYVRLGHRRD